MTRIDGRSLVHTREVVLTPQSYGYAEGSVLASFGRTTVLCNATLDQRTPKWLSESGHGWVTAEYAMLPRATHTRNARESVAGKRQGRSIEISRLIGRALRASVDYTQLPPMQVLLDCDVLVADGGTRTTAISGSSVALAMALLTGFDQGIIKQLPTMSCVQAVSVGIVDGELMVDLCYDEDSRAEVDATIVASGDQLIEVHMSGEGHQFSRAQLHALIDIGMDACDTIRKAQRAVLREAVGTMTPRKDQRFEQLVAHLHD